MNNTFQVGDEVCHSSLPSILWVIEKIEGDEASCTTVKSSLENKRERFYLSSLKKFESKKAIVPTIKAINPW